MRIAILVVQLAMILVGVLLLLDFGYMMRGSLEMYPMPEDEEKVRTLTIILGLILAAAEIGLFLVLRWLRNLRSAASA